MNYKSEIDWVFEELKKKIDPKRKDLAEKNHPTSLKVLGVRVPDEKVVTKQLRVRTKNWETRDKIDLAIELAMQNCLEFQHVGYEYVNKDPILRTFLTENDVLQLKTVMDNWVSVDSYSVYISGYAWREGILSESKILEWAQSGDVWERRISLVSTITLNQRSQGGKGDTDKTIMLCDILKADKHPMIVKAMSWALRTLITPDREAVEKYIMENKDILHPMVLREVKHKLEKGTKN